MTTPVTATAPILTTPARAEQATFRALLNAMSRPGTVEALELGSAGGGGAWDGALAVLQALIDHEVTFAVLAGDDAPREQLLRRTAARLAAPGEAQYVLADAEHAVEALSLASGGELETPERSATVVLAAERVGAGEVALELSGPGIPDTATLRLGGLPAGALGVIRERNAAFPLGIDVVFVDGDGHVACLPRSARIEGIDRGGESPVAWATEGS